MKRLKLRKKLSLNADVIRNLSNEELNGVAGGGIVKTSNWCSTNSDDKCNIKGNCVWRP